MRFLEKRKQERLYKQWTKHAELPPEAASSLEAPTDAKMTDVKMWVAEEGRFYRFRVGILNVVKKILRLE
jgi:hypothetical protein